MRSRVRARVRSYLCACSFDFVLAFICGCVRGNVCACVRESVRTCLRESVRECVREFVFHPWTHTPMYKRT